MEDVISINFLSSDLIFPLLCKAETHLQLLRLFSHLEAKATSEGPIIKLEIKGQETVWTRPYPVEFNMIKKYSVEWTEALIFQFELQQII